MISKIRTIRSNITDPYTNIAVEKFLTFSVKPEECILFLWQNKNTVVIGKNQSCFDECRVQLLEDEGGHLARRLSGGGAVYHDMGNLNFTFCTKEADYDVSRQLGVIADAVESFGIKVEKSGRNDLLADGRKFSGNAFFCGSGSNSSEKYMYHHGTILINADTEKMSRYLSVSDKKLSSKGVASVRSRVVNLSELSDRIGIEPLCDALFASFEKIYKSRAIRETSDEIISNHAEEISSEAESFSSPEWKYGRMADFDHTISDRFNWGCASIKLSVNNGIITDAILYTDSMSLDFPDLSSLITGCPFFFNQIADRLTGAFSSKETEEDILRLIKEGLS